MKKIITSTLLCSSIFFLAQQVRTTASMFGDPATFSGIKSSSGKVLTYAEISGSPYLTNNFSEAKIGDNPEKIPVRYNSYSDEVEFKKNDQVLSLLKKPEFSRIEIASPKQTIVLLETSDDLSGYFFELVGGKNILYKKVKTRFVDFVPAANSYASDRPAAFKTLDPVYYIKTEKGFIKKPKNQKEVIEQFPDKKEALTTFFKSNKIKFDKDEDLIKLVTFLNQN